MKKVNIRSHIYEYINLLIIINILSCLFFFAVTPLRAQAIDNEAAQAPFGLKWGMSAEDVRAQNIKLSELSNSKEFGATYQASDLPRTLSDARLVGLSFGFQNKLWRIIVFGQKVDNDPYGAGVKARYSELAAALSDKYGSAN